MKYRKKTVVIEAYQTKEEKIIHTLEGSKYEDPYAFIKEIGASST